MTLPIATTAPATRLSADVLMVGSGISGLFCALKLADQGKTVIIVTKNALTENNSRYAQGGIAAVLPENTDDSLAHHLQDTLDAGAGLCERDRVDRILRDGHLAIADLLLLGVPFDRDEFGKLALTLEGGHQARRILHAGGDATGKQVELTLTRHVESHANITVMPFCMVAELVTTSDAATRCLGAHVIDSQTGKTYHIAAGATVLATGGAGRLFTQTTNPAGATGNGFVLAAQAGATLVDMEFIQFHPTGFVHDGQTQFLLSEALRGEGGILRDGGNAPLMAGLHPLGDLAPRDIVARAIHHSLHIANNGPVTLDMTHHSETWLAERFPNLVTACQAFGVDMATMPLPVAPAAHYMMGGVAVDDSGFTGVPGLYAIGETVWTGLHGANRLASNSLLECVVIARNLASHLATQTLVTPEALPTIESSWVAAAVPAGLAALEATFREKMTQYAGIIRTAEGLTMLASWLNEAETTLIEQHWDHIAPAGIDLAQQIALAQWIAASALQRQESRGAHYREDCPTAETLPRHQTFTVTQGRPQFQWQVAQNETTLAPC